MSDAENNFELAVKCIKGDGVEKDIGKAVGLLLQSAAAGYGKAQYNLGVMYTNGMGVEKNKNEAIKWIELAAAQGHKQAEHALSKFNIDLDNTSSDITVKRVPHVEGLGNQVITSQKDKKCPACQTNCSQTSQFCTSCGHKFELPSATNQTEQETDRLIENATSGDAKSQYKLGVMYMKGVGVEKNKGNAKYWLKKSAQQGNTQATEALEIIERLPDSDVIEASAPVGNDQMPTANVADAEKKPTKLTLKQWALLFVIGMPFGLLLGYLKSGPKIDVNQLAQSWECIQVSEGPEKGHVGNYQFNRENRFQWTVFLENMGGNMTVTGDYSLNKNKFTMDNLYIQLPGPMGQGGATRSRKTIHGTITKLTNEALNFRSITTDPNINMNNDNPPEEQCKKMSN